MGRFSETNVSVETIREGYIYGRLSEGELDPDPYKQFEIWFQEALDAGVDLPDAMTLATVDADGRPSARIVGLRGFDRSGFAFYTNYGSQKAREIDANPQVSLVFHWPDQGRQVRVNGTALKMTVEDSTDYFNTRDRESKLAAWASKQSEPIDNRGMLEERFREAITRFGDGEIPLPDFWGGYRILPDCMEFWQGREFRMHDRFRYTLEDDSTWSVTRLFP
jgi:pyridoxamine 5'-phosphate oxidase